MKLFGISGYLVVYSEGIGGTKAPTWWERQQATPEDPRWIVPFPLKMRSYLGIGRYFDYPPSDVREQPATERFIDFIVDRADDARLLNTVEEAHEVLTLLPRDVFNYEIIYVENCDGSYDESLKSEMQFLGYDVANIMAYEKASLIVYVHQYPVIQDSELQSLVLNENGLFAVESDALTFYQRHIKLIGRPYRGEFAVMRVYRVPLVVQLETIV